ncbi:hypothetical protein IC229_13060 [Spirosoma sp. BT702]|uniref:Uncharacterized protein n=1 Tax=Spirosoma profusum TaxID=2771354 RepID=A0A926XVU2_9BACT|nr:hypothetical protein [Spirosoma profusum]MBD2701573.1 hypothetical protein [Spirosoma profusum]
MWSCGRVPVSSDAVRLSHTVTLPANYSAQAKRLIFIAGQLLRYQAGSRLRLGL